MEKTISIEKLYQLGIITFEQAVELSSVGAEVSQPTLAKEAVKQEQAKKAKSAPRQKSAKKSKKQKPQPEVTVMNNGMKYHTPKKHELSDYQVKRLDAAVEKVRAAGYSKAEWRVEGKWAWIYTFSGEKGTGYTPAFIEAVSKAFKGSKWEYSKSRGAVVYKDFIK